MGFPQKKTDRRFEESHKMVENIQNKISGGRLREPCVLCLGILKDRVEISMLSTHI